MMFSGLMSLWMIPIIWRIPNAAATWKVQFIFMHWIYWIQLEIIHWIISPALIYFTTFIKWENTWISFNQSHMEKMC
jgi:hypothetical protein